MSKYALSCAALAVACLWNTSASSQIRIGGPNLKTANVHVDRGNLLKGQSTVALGAFRVIFVTSDSTSATGTNNNSGDHSAGDTLSSESVQNAMHEGRSNAKSSARLVGLDKPLMQKMTDQIYADFLEKAKASGYTIMDSQALAAKSSTYKGMPMTENFSDARFGTYVVPTGQMSVEQANDSSTAVGRGSSSGVFGGFKKGSQNRKKSDSDKDMPVVSQEAGGVPVWGVTMVVSFAKFKSSGFTHWGQGAHTSTEFGPTINGVDEEDAPMQTGVQFWNKDSNKQCVNCYKLAAAVLRGDVHTTDRIGDIGKPSKTKDVDWVRSNSSADVKGLVFVDEADYEKNELAQAKNTNQMLIEALAKER